MALGTLVAAAVAYSGSGGGANTVSPAYPSGILATDVVLLIVGQKPATANGGGIGALSGWTLRASLTQAGNYGTTLGADTGNTNLYFYTWNTPVAGQTGNLSVSLTDNNIAWAFICRIPTGGGTIIYGSATGSRTTAPTSGTPYTVTLTNGATAPNLQSGDVAVWGMTIPTDVLAGAGFSAHTISSTGTTFGTPTEINESVSGTGNDIGGYTAWVSATSGTSTAAPTIGATATGTVTNVRGPIVLLRLRELAKITLIADPSSYSLTGSAATLLENRAVNAETGLYSITGFAATLGKATSFNTEPGTYSITGQAATLAKNRILSADPGSYEISGQPAGLYEQHYLNLEAGAYSVTGQDAALARQIDLSATTGSYVVTGVAATLEKTSNTIELLASPGSYSVVGSDAALLLSPALMADSGSYTVTGAATELLFGFTLSAEAGSYAVTGSNASFVEDYVVAAEAGSYAVSGEAADLDRTYILNPETGAYVVTGDPAEFVRGLVLSADSAAYDVDGYNAELSRAGEFMADPGSYDITGDAADATKDYLLIAEPETEYVVAGYVDPGYVIQTGYYINGFPTLLSYPKYPAPNQVLLGVLYGPNGNDYVGTYVCPTPTIKQPLYIFDD